METGLYGYSAETLAELTGRTLDTTKRWKRAGRAPNARQRLLSLALEGNLGAIDQSWHGFTIRSGQIWTPEAMSVTPGQIRAIPYRLAQLRELERRLAEPQQWNLL